MNNISCLLKISDLLWQYNNKIGYFYDLVANLETYIDLLNASDNEEMIELKSQITEIWFELEHINALVLNEKRHLLNDEEESINKLIHTLSLKLADFYSYC